MSTSDPNAVPGDELAVSTDSATTPPTVVTADGVDPSLSDPTVAALQPASFATDGNTAPVVQRDPDGTDPPVDDTLADPVVPPNAFTDPTVAVQAADEAAQSGPQTDTVSGDVAETNADLNIPGDAPASPSAASVVPTAAPVPSNTPFVVNDQGALATAVPPADAAADVAATEADMGLNADQPVDQTDATTVSKSDPTAPPLDTNIVEAQPDTPPTDNPDVYAQNLAANVAGSPALVVTSQPLPVSDTADVNPRYDLRSEDQLRSLESASAALLEAVRGLCVAGLTRGQLYDACTLAVDQLYVERNDAQTAGSDDPYPNF